LVQDRDPITYLYTSGTTSFPKGVVGNHTAIYLESVSMALEARFDDEDRFVAMMPMFHTAQLNCHCTAAIMVGATIYIERGFEAGRLLGLIETERITQIFGLTFNADTQQSQDPTGSRGLCPASPAGTAETASDLPAAARNQSPESSSSEPSCDAG
jgi:acyl-CoA synthetase (AMP-forming)/AMP-acid ligase II